MISIFSFLTQWRSRLTYVPFPLHIENLPRICGNPLILGQSGPFLKTEIGLKLKYMFDVPLCNHTACKPMIWKVTRQDRRIGQTHSILSYGYISLFHLNVFIPGEGPRCHDAVHARRQVGIVAIVDIKIGLIGLWYRSVLSTMSYIGDQCTYNNWGFTRTWYLPPQKTDTFLTYVRCEGQLN